MADRLPTEQALAFILSQIRPWIKQRLRVAYLEPAKLQLRMIRIKTGVTNQQPIWNPVNYLRLQFIQLIAKATSIAKTEGICSRCELPTHSFISTKDDMGAMIREALLRSSAAANS